MRSLQSGSGVTFHFKSHPELLSKADPVLTGSLLKWEHLSKKGFPMIFHGVIGEDKREARSPSYFNAEEAFIVVNYLEKLLTNKPKVSIKFNKVVLCRLKFRAAQKFFSFFARFIYANPVIRVIRFLG